MTNKELQKILKKYPDDVEVYVYINDYERAIVEVNELDNCLSIYAG